MRCATRRNSPAPELRLGVAWRLQLALPLVLLAVCGVARAESIYRWTGSDGSVHYSNVAPKGVTDVTRVEVDPDANTTAGGQRPSHPGTDLPPPRSTRAEPPQTTDILTQRRQTRARLEASLAGAQERVDLAKVALAEAGGPRDDEFQVIQQSLSPDAATRTGVGEVQRSNCHAVVGHNGKTTRVCPGVVPNQQYYERVQQLEDAVKHAEDDLAAAQTAYRRGVD